LALAELKEFFVGTVLPEWLSVAFDEQSGQFVEGLDLDGAPDMSGIVRTRSAARQIYVYAHAAALGLAPAGGLEKAERALDELRDKTWIATGKPGYASAYDIRSGAITNDRRELYDHACVLLALAWLSKATGKARYLSLIDEISHVIDTTLAAPHGGWAEDDIGSVPRRQNPHMHYFEACLALWETGHGSQHAARAEELFTLFRTRFFDAETRTLREFFGPAWELADHFRSGRLDPGHMSEWVWLIGRYDRLTGSNYREIAASLLQRALHHGRTRTAPFLVDEMDNDGAPLVNSRRLWPQAELLKALIVSGQADDGARWSDEAESFCAVFAMEYLGRGTGPTLRDAFDLDGTFIARSMPGSSLYHLWSMVAEIA
jgi:mannose-6-phosphate isomerase